MLELCPVAGAVPGHPAGLASADGAKMRSRPRQLFDRYCVIKMDSGAKRNTDQFAAGQFRPHGRVDIWAEGNVMRLDAIGPFNKEVVIALGATWNSLFDDMPVHGPFANIITLRRSVVVSQEVLDAFGEFLHANNRAGRGASAVAFVVAPDVEGRSLMLPMFAATYAAAGREFAAFATDAEADVWVRAKLKENPARPQVPTDAN
jgi:hypothetical protein